MSSDNTSNQSEVLNCVCKTIRAKDCGGAMDPVLAGKAVKRRRRAYIVQPSQTSLSRSDLNRGLSSRAQFWGAMAAKRLKRLYFANIGAATAEFHGPTDLMDLITASIFQRLVMACERDLRSTVDTTGSTEVVGKTVKRGRRAYIMQPSQISLSRPAVDLDHIFSTRAKFYGAMATKRLKALYYGHIASAKAESQVPNDLVLW